jgi:hypothetical protein
MSYRGATPWSDASCLLGGTCWEAVAPRGSSSQVMPGEELGPSTRLPLRQWRSRCSCPQPANAALLLPWVRVAAQPRAHPCSRLCLRHLHDEPASMRSRRCGPSARRWRDGGARLMVAHTRRAAAEMPPRPRPGTAWSGLASTALRSRGTAGGLVHDAVVRSSDHRLLGSRRLAPLCEAASTRACSLRRGEQRHHRRPHRSAGAAELRAVRASARGHPAGTGRCAGARNEGLG